MTAFAWYVYKPHANRSLFCQHVNKPVPTQHCTDTGFLHCPWAVSYQDCALQMTATMGTVTTTAMSTSVATMAMRMATTTPMDLLQQQPLLLQAESALFATLESYGTNVLKVFLHW